MTNKITTLTCSVCNTSWVDTSLRSSKIRSDLEEEKKIGAPCFHGRAFLGRQYYLNSGIWYYE